MCLLFQIVVVYAFVIGQLHSVNDYFMGKREQWLHFGKWEPDTSGMIGYKPERAVPGGTVRNVTEYICRYEDRGELTVGRLSRTNARCYIGKFGDTKESANYEFLLRRPADSFRWDYAADGEYPKGAVIGSFCGKTPVFICKVSVQAFHQYNELTGKLIAGVGKGCYVGGFQREDLYTEYVVLVKEGGQPEDC